MKSIESRDIENPTTSVKNKYDNGPQINFLNALLLSLSLIHLSNSIIFSAILSMVSLDSHLDPFYESMEFTPKYSTFEPETTDLP